MKEFIQYLVSLILSEDINFEIKEELSEEITIYTIFVPKEEMGKIIGKEGKVISAIRTLSRLKAAKEQKKILIKAEELTA